MLTGRAYNVENASRAYSTLISQDATRVARFEVREGDYWPRDVLNDRNRSELRQAGDMAALNFDTDYWVSYSFRLDASASSTWAVYGQFHASEDDEDDSLPPVFAVEIMDGVLGVRTRSAWGNPTLAGGSPEKTSVIRYSTPFAWATWHTVVMQIRFARTSNGFLRFWYDGTERFNGSIPLGYNDTYGPFWKFGIYREAATQRQIAEYANMEIGTASLLSRVGNPLPLPTA